MYLALPMATLLVSLTWSLMRSMSQYGHITLAKGHCCSWRYKETKNILWEDLFAANTSWGISQFESQDYLSLLVDKSFYTVRTWHRSPSALSSHMFLQKGLSHRLLAVWTMHSCKLTMCQMILGKEKRFLKNDLILYHVIGHSSWTPEDADSI